MRAAIRREQPVTHSEFVPIPCYVSGAIRRPRLYVGWVDALRGTKGSTRTGDRLRGSPPVSPIVRRHEGTIDVSL